MSKVYESNSLPDYLNLFYKRLFPYGPYYRWLTYGLAPKDCFQRREFSFTLADDVYIRYQSFNDQQEMEKAIQSRCPHKIDLGAVFNHRPRDHKQIQGSLQPETKELVFDIDMTDYDDVRKCCSGADICPTCWTLMKMAVKVLDKALREDFGWEHLLWVYSGRRGVHCWVCDESARQLSSTARSAVVEYLTLVKGGEQQKRKVVLLDDLHPSVKRSLDIIDKYFESYALVQQDILGDEDDVRKMVPMIPDKKLADQVLTDLSNKKLSNSLKKWAQFQARLKKELDSSHRFEFRKSSQCDKEIMLAYCYPRLDVNVSKGVNHLLKSPFCVHPKTGRVCVPIDPIHVDEFDPFSVPLINEVLEELNTAEGKGKEYKKTSLARYIDYFEDFVKKLEKSWSGKRRQRADESMDF